MATKPPLEPLAISCTATDCDNDLHCFLQKKRRDDGMRVGGPCRDCGADLVQWDRITTRNRSDAEYKFRAMKQELIRHEFWHRKLDQRAVNYAHRKGRQLLKEAAKARIVSSVGGAKHPREGRQTPFEGNILYYAQHAVAACCRKCIEYWHGIESGRALTEPEQDYLADLLMLYVKERLPNLANQPIKVPPIRNNP
ncbi:DUF4186 family protein [Archangium gephyra]|uniref:DUF4186 family protein n=1 Tax=Archangium gephyra TaxID=48 RepID=UPI00094B20FC|nr:DUF4186 family protein [Archangium gephyra]